MDFFARAVEAVLAPDVKAERVVLVGHSMGTPVILKSTVLRAGHRAGRAAESPRHDAVGGGGHGGRLDERDAGSGGPNDDVPAVPILGIYAEPAPIASREAVLRSFPAAEFTQIAGTGHFLMLEKPAEFNAVLMKFIASVR